jgi:purine-binding chemotaxis protein CheW
LLTLIRWNILASTERPRSRGTAPKVRSAARLLLFGVGGRWYACDLASVREIVGIGQAARLPAAPDHVLGVLNVRGTMITAVDLGVRLGGAPVDRVEGSLLLIEASGKVLGVAVDSVRDVLSVEAGAEEAAPDAARGEAATSLIRGLVQMADGVASVLDPAALIRETLVLAGGDP